MFLGIFSSILPYIIAAGFYLLWMLFSFVQPAIQKALNQKDNSPAQKIIYAEEKNTDTDNYFFYENSNSDEDNYQQLISDTSRQYNILHDIPINWPPGENGIHIKTFFLDAHFCRPPPAC